MGIRSAFSPFGGGKLIKKGTIFFESNIPSTSNLEIELPKGRYQIVAVGAGGSGAALYDANSNWWGGGAGASGGAVLGEIVLAEKKIAQITIGKGGNGANGKGAGGSAGGLSKVQIDSAFAQGAGGGGGACANWGIGQGGAATQSGLENHSLLRGNNGAGGGKGAAMQIGAASVYEGHGAGSNSGGGSYQTQAGGNGYVKIVYLDRK